MEKYSYKKTTHFKDTLMNNKKSSNDKKYNLSDKEIIGCLNNVIASNKYSSSYKDEQLLNLSEKANNIADNILLKN